LVEWSNKAKLIAMIKKYTNEEVLSFLRSNPVMSIAVTFKGIPRSSIVIFAVDKDMVFYFATGTQSYKAKALMTNKNISFSVWEYKKILVQGLGEATALNSKSELDRTLEKLAKVAGDMKDFWPPLLHLWNQDYTIFKVKIRWMRVLDLTSQKIKESSLPFQDIIS
jgi:nitroimidazol reductase NimA-like FMN-containing flavoprotein (pyridoxamine 5'-phosphate oxidase superfamily)